VRRVVFHAEAFAHFTDWAKHDPVQFERITRLITETSRDPFHGIGKPEPLRHSSTASGRGASTTNTGWCTRSRRTRSSSRHAAFTIE